MEFPYLGDAVNYMQLGKACANVISGISEPSATCYNSIRPLGIILYYALPYLVIKNDQILVNYVTLLANLLFLFLLLLSGLLLVKQFAQPLTYSRKNWLAYMGQAVFFIIALPLSIGYLPVRLSDHQSLASFMFSVVLLSNGYTQNCKRIVFLAGILGGISVLLKQNYVVAIAALILCWFLILGRKEFKTWFPLASYYSLGASIALIQVFWVYHHSGVFWLYEPAALEVYAPSNMQPSVELVAYTDPIRSAYLTKLNQPVSPFAYFCIKFYYGFTKFFWAAYLGKAPLQLAPETVEYSTALLVKSIAFFLVTLGASITSLCFKNKWLSILVFSALLAVVVTTLVAHVESRYYYFPRIVYLLLFIAFLNRALEWLTRTCTPRPILSPK